MTVFVKAVESLGHSGNNYSTVLNNHPIPDSATALLF